jgi:hypothetical protein
MDANVAEVGLAVGLMALLGLVLAPRSMGRVQPGTRVAGVMSAPMLYAVGVVVIGAMALASLLAGAP